MAATVIKWSKGGPDCAELRKRHGPRNHTKQAGVRIASRKPTQDRRRFRERPGTGALIEQSFANAREDREKGKARKRICRGLEVEGARGGSECKGQEEEEDEKP